MVLRIVDGVAVCADKECTPVYQADSGDSDEMDSEPSNTTTEFDYHTAPHDKADVVTALATVKGS